MLFSLSFAGLQNVSENDSLCGGKFVHNCRQLLFTLVVGGKMKMIVFLWNVQLLYGRRRKGRFLDS